MCSCLEHVIFPLIEHNHVQTSLFQVINFLSIGLGKDIITSGVGGPTHQVIIIRPQLGGSAFLKNDPLEGPFNLALWCGFDLDGEFCLRPGFP